jgi:hypothetical protein
LSPFESFPDDALVLGPDATWFRPPGGSWHDLRERQAARKILLRLAELHRAGSTEGLSMEALGEAGWPGERVSPSARTNRINVALAYLRKLGLKRYLERSASGYFLPRTLLLYRVASPPG